MLQFCFYFLYIFSLVEYRIPGLARLEVGNETDDTRDSPPVLDRPVKPALSMRGRGLPVCAFQGSPGVSRGPFSLSLFLTHSHVHTRTSSV